MYVMTILAGFALGLLLHDILKELVGHVVLGIKKVWAKYNGKQIFSS